MFFFKKEKVEKCTSTTAAITRTSAPARLGTIINQERVEGNGIGQNVVTNVVTTNRQRIELLRVTSL